MLLLENKNQEYQIILEIINHFCYETLVRWVLRAVHKKWTFLCNFKKN